MHSDQIKNKMKKRDMFTIIMKEMDPRFNKKVLNFQLQYQTLKIKQYSMQESRHLPLTLTYHNHFGRTHSLKSGLDDETCFMKLFHKPFYAPNFEKVGSILVSACAFVRPFVRPFVRSKQNSS